MARGTTTHRCSHPSCDGMTVADLVLTERQRLTNNRRSASDKFVINHIYLCEKHYKEMIDFLDAYEGR